MVFSNIWPEQQNQYFWVLDKKHAVPEIGFIYDDVLYSKGIKYNRNEEGTKKFIRIGSMIRPPHFSQITVIE